MTTKQPKENQVNVPETEVTPSKRLLDMRIGETGFISRLFIHYSSRKLMSGKKYYTHPFVSVYSREIGDAQIPITRTGKEEFVIKPSRLAADSFYEIPDVLKDRAIELTVLVDNTSTRQTEKAKKAGAFSKIASGLQKLFHPEEKPDKGEKSYASIQRPDYRPPPRKRERYASLNAKEHLSFQDQINRFSKHFGLSLANRNIYKFKGLIKEMSEGTIGFAVPWALSFDEFGNFYFDNTCNVKTEYSITGTPCLPVLFYNGKYYFDIERIHTNQQKTIRLQIDIDLENYTQIDSDKIYFGELKGHFPSPPRHRSQTAKRLERQRLEPEKVKKDENKTKQVKRFGDFLGVKLENIQTCIGSISGMPDNTIGWTLPWNVCLDLIGNYYLDKSLR